MKRYAGIGLLAGLGGGLLGVGGGFLMVPLQVMWAGTPQKQANANSLAAVVPIALCGGLVYWLAASTPAIDFRAAALFAAGGVLGSYFGARLLVRFPERALKVLVAAILALVGIRELVFP